MAQHGGDIDWARRLRGVRVHMTGVKGTGMAALAEVLTAHGARVTGSDVAERFFTDQLLERIGIEPRVGFTAEHVPADIELLIYSAAYGDDNPERIRARQLGVAALSYTEALGALSTYRPSMAVAGVHGKTSTTAMVGSLVAAGNIPATVIVGSAVPAFGGSATLLRGETYLIAETCEYRRHFLDFTPTVLIVTSVEADHLDYFRDAGDVTEAFVEFALKLPDDGGLVYCADDPGAREVSRRIAERRPEVAVMPYGFSVAGPGAIRRHEVRPGEQRFVLETHEGPTDWLLRVPGGHMVRNAAAAILALRRLAGANAMDHPAARDALSRFTGTRRRSEIVGRADGVTVVDDYAHHPTAIKTTLAGFREFWPGSRLIVDFMSHTYTRTAAMLREFAESFGAADILVLNDIYASARETNDRAVSGKTLYEATAAVRPNVYYEPDFDRAADRIESFARAGDVVVTMGAGNNAKIGVAVIERLRERERAAGASA